MATKGKRYVRNATGGDVFVKGHGVVPADFEGELAGDAVAALVDAGVLAEAKPDSKTNTDEKEGGS